MTQMLLGYGGVGSRMSAIGPDGMIEFILGIPPTDLSPFVYFGPPLGDDQDDWPALNALMASVAGTKAIVFRPGNYSCQTSGVVPSGTILFGGPDVIITQNLPTSPYSPLDAAFTAVPVDGDTASMTSNAAAGATIISIDADIAAVGDYVIVSPTHIGPFAGLRSRTYRVELVTDSGGEAPFHLTLDRPIRDTLTIGDAVTQAAPPLNILIDGLGMLMRGVGQRFVELAGAVNCTVRNITGKAQAGDIAFSFDVGGLDCLFENIYSDGGGVLAAACISLESCERSRLVNCTARNSGVGVFGIAIYDCANCSIEDCYAPMNGNAGLSFVSDGNAPLACQDCTVRGGDYSANTLHGVWMQSGSSDITLESVVANWNGASGLQVGDGTNASANIFYTDCISRGNLHGAGTQAPVTGCYAENCDFSENTAAMASVQSDFIFDTCTAALPTTVTNIIIFSAAVYTVRLVDCTISSARVGGINNLQPLAGVTLDIDGCNITIGSTGLVPQANSVINVQRTTITESTPGVSGMIVNGGTLRVGPFVDADGTTAPLTVSSGFCNRGQVVANGVTAVPVAWPELKSTERVQLTLHTKGGTPSAMPAITYTPGTNFTLTSYAADSSTYDYVIE